MRSSQKIAADFDPDWGVSTADTAAPRVNKVAPAENATGVSPTANVSAFFSEAMNPSSINTTTVRLRKAGTSTNVGATVTYDSATKKAILNPKANLSLGAAYEATVTTGTKDLAGNALDQNTTTSGNQPKTWKFTSGSSSERNIPIHMNARGGAPPPRKRSIQMINTRTTTKTNHYFRALMALAVLAVLASLLVVLAASPAHASLFYTVNDTGDEADTNPGDGLCDVQPSAPVLRCYTQGGH